MKVTSMVLQSLAHQAAVAIENIRFYERAQQLAVMEERSRLARELHDAVTQTLFSASLMAEALPDRLGKRSPRGRELLQELRRLEPGRPGRDAHAAAGTAPGSPGGNAPGRPAAPVGRSRQRAGGHPGDRAGRRAGHAAAFRQTCILPSTASPRRR